MANFLSTIGFDADDTLWHNERFFRLTQERFAELLQDHTPGEILMERLLEAEKRNIKHYGFGIKGFVLSMIETAIEVTESKVPATVISELIAAGREMLNHPIELLPCAREAVEEISESHRVILITKGDLLDQERKLAQSGLGELFDEVEVVSDKSSKAYVDIFSRHGDGTEHSMMVGNSMRSDIRPMIEAGGWGVYTPHEYTWDYEKDHVPDNSPRYREIENLGKLPELVRDIG
ncbi:MAG: HAD family hydrolase [Roseovarius sp.]|nr:HAD family hydrolase [Roseovarius sp.]MCY4207115.1 HAD family hydrolase [Roseovarius sp.]MCY4292385.1 HAD family hydrolase [Roseovarius sp.]